jgi:hypothetical protein
MTAQCGKVLFGYSSLGVACRTPTAHIAFQSEDFKGKLYNHKKYGETLHSPQYHQNHGMVLNGEKAQECKQCDVLCM